MKKDLRVGDWVMVMFPDTNYYRVSSKLVGRIGEVVSEPNDFDCGVDFHSPIHEDLHSCNGNGSVDCCYYLDKDTLKKIEEVKL